MSDDRIVEIKSLTHRYAARTALDDLSLDVERGTVLAVLGPNGSGKSTLFKILTTLMKPSSGSARVAGADVVEERSAVRRRIGVLFQHPSLDAKLTVNENLMHQGHLYGLRGAELRTRMTRAVERYGIGDRTADRVATLSGGLQRRVELAKALLHCPDVLILDEPSTGLDPGARAVLMDHLTELRRSEGVTVLLTTHLMDEAERCDLVAILHEGRLVALDSPSSLTATIGGDVLTVSTKNARELAAKITERFGMTAEVVHGAIRIERERGHAFVPELIEAFPGRIDSITVGKPTLGDVFLARTGHRLRDTSDDLARRS